MGKRDRRRAVDPHRGWVFRFWVSRETEKAPRERERVVERERDRGESHGERERGSRLARRRGNGDSRGCGCHRQDFEDIGHGGPGLPPLAGLSPYRSTRSLSRSEILFFFFFFSFKE
jgi:hypothetical protein